MWVGFYFAYLYDYLRQVGVVQARVTKHVQLYENHAIIWKRLKQGNFFLIGQAKFKVTLLSVNYLQQPLLCSVIEFCLLFAN